LRVTVAAVRGDLIARAILETEELSIELRETAAVFGVESRRT
jgi:hypothetical protein